VAAADLTAEEDLAVEEEVVDSAVGSGEASVVVSAVHPAAAVVSAEVAVAEEDLEVSMLNRMATAKHKQHRSTTKTIDRAGDHLLLDVNTISKFEHLS